MSFKTAEGTSTLDPLLASQQVGSMQLKNRVVMAPHSTHYADQIETDRLTAYYEARARGGVGLIVHEPVIVHKSSLSRVGKVWGYDERNVVAYRKTTDAVHAYGTHIVCQLIHNGRQVDGHESRMPAWYPGEAARSGTIEVTHAMTTQEIKDVVDSFANAARICKDGRFDGVEIHAAHGYLLQAFLSPASNQRSDQYGGSTENRMRIVVEIIEAIKAATGDDFVVGVRLPGDEVQAGGLDATDCTEIAYHLSSRVDYISVVSGSLASFDRIVPEMAFPRGLNVDYAANIRNAVKPVPVMVTGRIAEPGQAANIVASGQADLIGLARSLITDPDWLHKAREGDESRIRPCVFANDCRDSIGGRRSLVCMVNPSAGHEYESRDPYGDTNRRIVVIGGGPGGMEAALTAMNLGDAVTLFEAKEELGGQLRLARTTTARSELKRLETYYSSELQSGAVDLRLGARPDEKILHQIDPDLIVLATGAEAIRNASDDVAATALDILSGVWVEAETVVLQDRSGGNSWPLFQTAELLAERGHRVVLVTAAHSLGTGIEAASVPGLLQRLRSNKVRIELLSNVSGASGRDVYVRRNDTDEVTSFADAAVVAEMGRQSSGVQGPWHTVDAEIKVVGDALAPRRIATAIAEGREAVQPYLSAAP